MPVVTRFAPVRRASRRPIFIFGSSLAVLAACGSDTTVLRRTDRAVAPATGAPGEGMGLAPVAPVQSAPPATVPETPSPATPAPTEPAVPSISTAGPLYVLHSTIDTADTRTGYLVTTSSIEADVSLDVTQGVEVPGGGYLYAPPGGDYFLMGGSEAPTFTRYELSASGGIEARGVVSFAQLGVQSTHRHVIFHSPEKAYFLDESQLQVIAFNPATMELLSSIPVPGFRCAEVETSFGTPIRREDGYYFPRGCWDLDVTSRGASLVYLDPVTDEVTVSHDSRCMGMQIGFLADSGDAYWFSDHDASVEWTYQRRDAPHDCALRLRAGQTTFDPDWELDLTTRTGGLSAVAAVPANGSSIWMKVFDSAAFTGIIPMQEIDWGLEVWRWGLLDVESSDPIRLNAEARLVVSYGYPIEVDGRSFSPVANSDYSETTLIELAEAGIEERIHVQGELRKIVRLR